MMQPRQLEMVVHHDSSLTASVETLHPQPASVSDNSVIPEGEPAYGATVEFATQVERPEHDTKSEPPRRAAPRPEYSRRVTRSIRDVARSMIGPQAPPGDSYRFVASRGWVPRDESLRHARDRSVWSVERAQEFAQYVLGANSVDGWECDVLTRVCVVGCLCLVLLSRRFNASFLTQLMYPICFPVVSLLFAILPFTVPYGQLSDGYEGNTSLFISLAIGAWLVYFAPISMIINLTKIPVKSSQQLGTTIVCALAFGLSSYLMARFWVFPVPFVTIIGAFPGFLLCVVLVYKVMIPHTLRARNPHTAKAIKTGVLVSALSLVMMGLWAAFRVAFVLVQDSGHWQTVMCVAIPILKMSARWTFERIAMTADADLAPR